MAAVETIQYAETPAPGLETTRTLQVRAKDALGNTATDARTWKLDTKPPVVAVSGVGCGGFFNSAKTLVFTATDGNLAGVTATLDGAAFTSGATVSAEGAHTLLVSAHDGAAGHVTSVSCAFTLDYTPPQITFDASTPPDGAVRNSNFNLAASATDANLAANPDGLFVESAPGVPTLVDGNAAPGQLLVPFPALSLSDGAYTVTLRAKDKAGNLSAPATRTFVVDRTGPVFSVSTTPALVSGAWTNAAALAVSVAVSEANRSVAAETVAATGCTGPTGAAPYVFACGASEGLKAISASGSDAAGNSGLAVSRSYQVDRTAPVVAIEATSASGVVRGAFTVSALVDDNFKTLAGGSLDSALAAATVTGPCLAASASTASVVAAGPDAGKLRLAVSFSAGAADGSCAVAFAAKDKAGNNAAPVARMLVVDNTRPVVAVTSPIWATAAMRTVSGTITDANPAAVHVEVFATLPGGGTGALVAQGDVSPAAGAWSFAVTLPSDGLFQVRASGSDAAGNVSAVANASLGRDNAGPVVTVVAHTIANEAAPATNGCLVAFPAAGVNVDCSAANGVGVGLSSLEAAGTPTVFKYSHRFRDLAAAAGQPEYAENPIEWRFTVTDAQSGLDAAAIKYRVVGPGCGDSGLLAAAAPHLTLLDAASGLYSFKITNATALIAACGADPLENRAGTWALVLEVKDLVANTTTTPNAAMDWAHKPLGVPVSISQGTSLMSTVPAANPLAPFALGNLSFATNNLAAIFNGSKDDALSAGRGLYAFTLDNPSDRPTRVAFFVPAPAPAMATYSRHAERRNAKVGTAAKNTVCHPKGLAAARLTHPDTGASAPACDGAGWAIPAVSDSDITNGSLTSPDSFKVLVLRPGGTALVPVPLATTASVDGNTAYEFVVDAGASGWRVVIASGNFSFLKPPGGFTLAELTAPGGIGRVTGKNYEDFSMCTATDDAIPPNCIESSKFRHFEATTAASVSVLAKGLFLNLRSRPAASPSTADLTAAPYAKDGQFDRSNAQNMTWSAGTETGSIPN